MSEVQTFTLMLAFGSFVAAIIFGMITVTIGIVNLIKKK